MGGCFDRLSTRTKAAYRLLENPALDWRVVLEMHAGRTEERIIQYRPKIALCLQDTSELDFSSQPGIAGLGRLNFEARRGLYIHPTLVVTPEGLALGVTDAWMRCTELVEVWARPPKGEAEFKESIRWPEGYERVAEMATRVPDTRLVYIADREGDLRELMDRAHQLDYPADYLVRAVHERNTAEGDKLWELVLSLSKQAWRPAKRLEKSNLCCPRRQVARHAECAKRFMYNGLRYRRAGMHRLSK